MTYDEDAAAQLALTPSLAGISDPLTVNWQFMGMNHVRVQVDPSTHIAAFSADPNWFGTETLTVTATWRYLTSDTATITVTVNPINDPPHWSPIPTLAMVEDAGEATVSLPVFLSDPDHPLSALTISTSNPIGLIASLETATKTLRLVPVPNFFGQASVEVTATDPLGASSSQQIRATITPVNDAPALSTIPNQSVREGGAFACIALSACRRQQLCSYLALQPG